jgi:uncharacterized protein
MQEELKPRGAPVGETPKSPLLRSLNKKSEKQDPKPHNAVEEALQAAPKEEHHDTRKVAIITGASSGIGKAVAVHLASNNYNLVLLARKKEGLHHVEQELAKYKIRTLVRECDVTKVAQVHDTVQHVIKAFGRIDVLVNNAGYAVHGPIESMKLEDVNGQMVTNYFGTVLFTKECLPKLKESKGVVVNMASIAGLVGIPDMAAYSASKFAIVGFSEALRYELDGEVDVCVVAPGKVKTDLFKHESFKDVAWAHDDSGIVPSAVAAVVDEAIRERKFMNVVPANYKVQLWLKNLLPGYAKKKLSNI